VVVDIKLSPDTVYVLISYWVAFATGEYVTEIEVELASTGLPDGAVGVVRVIALTVMTAVDDVRPALIAPFLVL
jgi:hypothetical protein